MADRSSPTVRARRLRQQLRQLRDRHGLTLEQVVARSGKAFNASTVARYESGDRIPRPADLRVLLDIYQVGDEQREHLMTLAKDARQRGWWWPMRMALKSGFGVYLGLESEAEAVRKYHSQLVPGLLQTEEYTRAVIRAIELTLGEEQVDERVRVRQVRQRRLVDEKRFHLWVVIDEAVLARRVGGPEVMREQLHQLLRLGRHSNITIQVLPFTAGAHASMEGDFSIMQFPDPDDADVVYLEQATSGLALEDPDDVRRYTLMFGQLAGIALSPERSAELIQAKADEL
ncbi:helix-turn-helix domain-containing protein [Bailinhaonella thermotolerans]|uniref:XRE family transcriptional regulator n=1 Tax=Bailinhaonella thermotolerans TaxID=1070861 RepID=A0A3A4BJ45_9ACTN|nr:helix-turn-helix transcriptional regulator [Bailinhaonella thermotolerans]RJL31272.1 XRE family transcriptional regulator [Bailinhaonella thermotolerans]